MDLSRYTSEAQSCLASAQKVAQQRKHQAIEVEHLLFALLKRERSGLPDLLRKVGVEVDPLALRIEVELAKRPKVMGGSSYLSPRFLEVTSAAEAKITERGQAKVDGCILGLAIADPGVDAGIAGQALREAGATIDRLTVALGTGSPRTADRRSPGEVDSDDPLLKYGRDLTALAREGRLDPVVGRHVEMRRILQVLSRRSKNNPVLVGDPGVGKTAIIEGLAQRIAAGDVPTGLKDKRLISLDMGALVAGAKLRGQFEERLRAIVAAVSSSDGQAVLFIDEIHTLVGAGAGDGAMDASNLLKPALARGELNCLGSTTPDEYRKYIEKDKALERRFAPIVVEPPSIEESVSILRGLKEKYEVHHGVRIRDRALEAAVALSDRYISGRALPDKAVDLIDEAASHLRIEIDSMPQELDQLERRITELAVEHRSLESEESTSGAERLTAVDEETRTLRRQRDELRARWQAELELIQTVRATKSSLERLHQEQVEAERDGDLDEAARVRFGVLPQLEADLARAQAQLDELTVDERLIKEAVDEEDVATVVESWTGIPLDRMLESEREKLVHMEDRLHRRVIGQDEAVTAIANAVRRARAGLKDPRRPIGSFFFLGPTGVGKTELAKALAEFLFDDESATVRLDMSEFMEKHAAARLVGSPPGYVGHDEGGQLTEAVRRRPYAAVLFDEVEKAHPDIFNLLLQILDDGRLSDSQGRVVDFKNTVVIMTSNIGSQHLLEGTDADGTIEEAARERCLDELRGHFRPEFLNRIDDVVVFHALTRPHIAKIADIQLAKLAALLTAQDLELEVTAAAKALICEVGYDPAYGARPLRRAILRLLQDPLSMALLDGRFEGEHRIRAEVDGEGEALVFIPAPR